MAQKSAAELIAEAKQRIREISPRQAKELRDRGENVLFIDVREQNEWNLGHIPGAIFIPRGTLEGAIDQRVPREQHVILYCASGNRSALAAESIAQMGYANVASMSGGFRGWAEMGGDIDG